MLKLGAADRATLAELARAAPHNGATYPCAQPSAR